MENEIYKEVIAKYPNEVEKYKNGDLKHLGLFCGEAMKISRGTLDPKETILIFKDLLQPKKPLSDISEDDLIQLARIHYKEYDEVIGESIHELLRKNTKIFILNDIDKMGIKAYQYLQSKGYELPKYY